MQIGFFPYVRIRPAVAFAILSLFLFWPWQQDANFGVGAAQARDNSVTQAINRHAIRQGVPISLAHAIVQLESGYRVRVVNRGNYGLMQIRLGTARALGFRGSGQQLLQPHVNLHYGMRYLGRAWRASGGNVCRTIQRYQTGRFSRHMLRATNIYCARALRIIHRFQQRAATRR